MASRNISWRKPWPWIRHGPESGWIWLCDKSRGRDRWGTGTLRKMMSKMFSLWTILLGWWFPSINHYLGCWGAPRIWIHDLESLKALGNLHLWESLSHRMGSELKVFLSFFILLPLTWISFFYPPLIFPQFWISFFYHFFILFLSSCPWPGYPFLSSPDFSSILDILFLSFFILFIIFFLSFFYQFLSSCPLPGDPFPYHPVNFPEFWISFLNPFCILLSLTWISFLYPLVLDLDKKRIKKG